MSTDANARGAPDPRARGALWERVCFGFVLLVWLECVVAAQVFIAWGAARAPVADDLALFYVKARGTPFWTYLWSLHNEHRVALPKLLQCVLYDWTGDIRSGMFLQAQIYGAAALACVLAARRLRGGSRPWDVFFPLMWLQIGNSENLLMGFQIGIALPGACVCTLLLCAVLSPQRLWPSRALASGLALLALPLCGGGGLLQAPALALYTGWLGFANRRHPQPRERRGALVHRGFALATFALMALYLVGFERPPQSHYTPRENPPWKLALANLCAPFGPDYFSWRPLLMPAIALGALLLALLFLRRGLRGRDPRAFGTLAALGGGALLVAGIAFGRPINGPVLVADRYIPLPAPFFVALTLGALVLLKQRAREVALASACVLMLFALPNSTRYGLGEGGLHRRNEHTLDALVEAHASWPRIREEYSENFMLGMTDEAEWLLRYYLQNGLPPFDRPETSGFQPSEDPLFDGTPSEARYPAPSGAREFATFETPPTVVRSEVHPVERVLDGEMVCSIQPPASFEFAVTAQNRHIVLQAGVPEMILRLGTHPGVHGRVILQREGQPPHVLGEIVLDPQRNAQQRGLQPFAFDWEPGGAGVLKLVFLRMPRAPGAQLPDRVSVRGLRIE